MTGLELAITFITAKQHGLVARWQADDAGIPTWVLDRAVRRGWLVPVHPGVYRLRGVPYTQQLRWLAAVLAGGRGARLSHRAAGVLHGYEIRTARPTITVAHGRACHVGAVEVHRSRRPGDVIVVDRIPVTSKPRTMLDLAATMPPEPFRLVLQKAVTGGVVKVEPLLAILDRRGGRGVEGTVALRDGLADGLVDERLQRELERLVARIVDTARVPKPIRQHEIVCDDGRRVVLDNAWPDRRIAIEADGLRWHGTAEQARKTRARARSITRTGWDLYAYGWSDATETPRETLAEVEAIFWAGSSAGGAEDPAQNDDRGDRAA